jgi:uncharacterized protein (TIGR02246 family)
MNRSLNLNSPAQAALQSWFDAVAKRDLEAIIPHYAADAVLLPTMLPGVYQGHNRIREYFTSFLAKDPTGEITEMEALPQGDNAVNFAGLYTFHLDTGPVKARFTFTYQKGEDGRWLIVHHHSSAEPK